MNPIVIKIIPANRSAEEIPELMITKSVPIEIKPYTTSLTDILFNK